MKFRRLMVVLMASAVFYGLNGCSLESTSEFSCGDEINESLFENPPDDTVFVKFESSNPHLQRIFSGIKRVDPVSEFIDGKYENLSIYQRQPKQNNGRLFGLGTQITDPRDSALVVMLFNQKTGDVIDEICRPTKVLQTEHDWSRWGDNLPGVEIVVLVPIDDEWITYSSDAPQNDEDLLIIEGAEYIGQSNIFVRLGGSFSVTLEEPVSGDQEEVSGSFVIDIQIGR